MNDKKVDLKPETVTIDNLKVVNSRLRAENKTLKDNIEGNKTKYQQHIKDKTTKYQQSIDHFKIQALKILQILVNTMQHDPCSSYTA